MNIIIRCFVSVLAAILIAANAVAGNILKKEDQSKGLANYLNNTLATGLKLDASTDKKEGEVMVAYAKNMSLIGLNLSGKLEGGKGQFSDQNGLALDTKLSLSYRHLLVKKYNESHSLSDQHLASYREKKENYLACKEAVPKDSQKTPDEVCADKKEALEKARTNWQDFSGSVLHKFCYLGGSVGATNTKYKYFDVDAKSSNSQTEDGYEAAFYIGKIHSSKQLKWELSLTYQNGYSYGSGNSSKNICRPLSEGSEFIECFDSRLLSPVQAKTYFPSLTMKKRFGEERVIKAVAVTAKYLTEETRSREDNNGWESNSKWALEVPVYLFAHNTQGFNSGVKFVYLSEVSENQDHFQASIFFGTPFALFK